MPCTCQGIFGFLGPGCFAHGKPAGNLRNKLEAKPVEGPNMKCADVDQITSYKPNKIDGDILKLFQREADQLALDVGFRRLIIPYNPQISPMFLRRYLSRISGEKRTHYSFFLLFWAGVTSSHPRTSNSTFV